MLLAGEFYAPDKKDESILAMASDPQNKLLITGDTKGLMAVWDIADFCTLHNKTVRFTAELFNEGC